MLIGKSCSNCFDKCPVCSCLISEIYCNTSIQHNIIFKWSKNHVFGDANQKYNDIFSVNFKNTRRFLTQTRKTSVKNLTP